MALPKFLTRLFRTDAAETPVVYTSPTGLPTGPLKVYLSGLRQDNMLDGLIGGHGMGGSSGGGWANPITGLGTRGRDKTMAASFGEVELIPAPELASLFNGNDIAQRIVSAKPREMFRRGWVLTFPGGPKDAAAKINAVKPDGAKPDAAKPGEPPQPGAAATAPKTDAADPNVTPGESGPAAPAPLAPKPGDAKDAAKDPTKPDPSAPQEGQNDGADTAKQVEEYAEKLELIRHCQEATIFGRLFGGGTLIIGADDGKDMSEPLDEENIRSIQFLNWVDRRWVLGNSYYEKLGPKYGQVETYRVTNPFGGTEDPIVHETRVIRFDGAPVDLVTRRRLAGWTLSVLQAAYDTMRQFDQSFQSIANLMSDMSQAVMKIQGLAQMISNDPKTLQTRMAMVDMARSSARMLFVDAENEEFQRTATPLSGVSDVIQMQMLRMAAAAEMPVAILFGREPSGLNATGDADFRRFYDTIAGEQKQVLEPKLRRLYTLICLAKDGPTKGKVPEGGMQFVWHKLYEPSEKEQAEIRWLMAQADEKYLQNEVLLPEEVAMSRFRSGDLHLDTEIQSDLRREKLKTAELPPSGAEKAKIDQENKKSELEVKAAGVAAKPGAAGPPKPAGPPK